MYLEPQEAMPGLCGVGKVGVRELQNCVPVSQAAHLLPLAWAGAGHPLRPGIMFLSSESCVSRCPMRTNLNLESLVRRGLRAPALYFLTQKVYELWGRCPSIHTVPVPSYALDFALWRAGCHDTG